MAHQKNRILFIAASALLFHGTMASADIINTDGEKGVVRTVSAKTMGVGMLNFGLGIDLFQSSSYVGDIYDVTKNEPITSSSPNFDAARVLSSNLFYGMGLTQWWDIAMALPFYYDWLGFNNLQDGGIGDLEISSKFLYPALTRRFFISHI